MKKMLALLAVATIPTMFGGCAACCPTSTSGCCLTNCLCPCNWFNRPATACPPAPVMAPAVCPPAPTYAAPLAATACPPPCPPVATQMMPQYVMPTTAAACNTCQATPQMMMAQPAYYGEPGCAYIEPGCGGPFMGTVGYGPSMPFEWGGCESGCCGDAGVMSGSIPAAPTPAPAPGE